MPLEAPPAPALTLRRVIADLGGEYAVNAFIAFMFSASGPFAIMLAVATQGGLSQSQLESWIFGSYALNGLVTIALCWVYRQPLVLLWTIAGAVLVGPALGHLSFAQVIGAYFATGALLLVLGLSGLVKRAMDALPMPIVMAMVAGVFLRFGLGLVHAVHDDFWIAGPMTLAFLALSALPRLARRMPPLIGALLVGGVLVLALGRFHPAGTQASALVHPNLYRPEFSLRALLELVVPLAVTVLAVQNSQGIAVLRAAGHETPINAITAACGVGSLLCACVGGVSTCLTGPVSAIISGSGERRRHYVAGMLVGVFSLCFGLLAPLFTRLLLAAPHAFIAALAGLAMLRVLQASFVVSFSGRFALGALVTFLITVANVQVLNVGAPFWGLVFGYAVSRLLERDDFRAR